MDDLEYKLIEESEANIFAAMLLIPEELITKDITKYKCIDYEDDRVISELAEKYGVSKQLMTIRIASLKLIDL